MADETLLSLAADIITAHVSHNSVSVGDLPTLIQSVFGALAGLGQAERVVEELRTPAVSVRSSVKPEAITCLECGTRAKMLKRHLATAHDLAPEDYRLRWNLARDYPMVAPAYAARRKELALSIGLGRKPKVGPTPAVPVKAVHKAKGATKPLAPEPVDGDTPVATTPAKAPARRRAMPKAPEAPATERPATKPKAPRKKLKVAFDNVDVPPVDTFPANAVIED